MLTFADKTTRIMRTATFSDFSSNIKNYFNSVIDNCDSIIVNRNSDEAAVLLSLDEYKAAVLLSLDEYNSLMETLYLMSSRDTMADIRKAEQDIKEGKGIEVNLDEL